MPVDGGWAMVHTQSNESTSSVRSRYSGPLSTPGTSPGVAMSTTGTPPQYQYPNNHTPNNYSDGQFNYEHGSNAAYFQASDSFQQEQHHTPKTLGWTINTDLTKLYEFVVKKGKPPYFALLAQWTPTEETPKIVQLNENEKNVFLCQYPSNCGKRFRRPADLERHYKNVHASIGQKECYRCDYKKCSRSEEQFTRKDHYRDHLKDYHKEDIGYAKGLKSLERAKWEKAQETWLKERNIEPEWWRCVRCLTRIYWKDGGWECGICKMPCEKERIGRRQNYQQPEQSQKFVEPEPNFASSCAACNGIGWVENMNREWERCYICSTPVQATENYYFPNQSMDTCNYDANYSPY